VRAPVERRNEEAKCLRLVRTLSIQAESKGPYILDVNLSLSKESGKDKALLRAGNNG
jgi:hypothetical protein